MGLRLCFGQILFDRAGVSPIGVKPDNAINGRRGIVFHGENKIKESENESKKITRGNDIKTKDLIFIKNVIRICKTQSQVWLRVLINSI
jgi:hypothetical protein